MAMATTEAAAGERPLLAAAMGLKAVRARNTRLIQVVHKLALAAGVAVQRRALVITQADREASMGQALAALLLKAPIQVVQDRLELRA